jgi:Ca-activated chloride channel family protein
MKKRTERSTVAVAATHSPRAMCAKQHLVLALALLLALLVLTPRARAQEILPPEPPVWRFDGLRIEYQRVTVSIEDQIATTHIDQLFVNENEWLLEGTYLFPLPPGATVSQLTMWVDGQPIEAKILEKDEARDIYDEIVRQLRDPALLEYVGTSAIQANVFPIPGNDERRIEIEYRQVLPAENGLIHFVYPQSTNLYTNTPLDEQSIRVEITSNEAIRAVYSPSHPVAIDRQGEFRALVGHEAYDVTPDGDFELYYTVSPENIGLNLLSYKEAGEDGFFLMLVAPSVAVDPNEVVAKDVILVLDTSGSMEGEKLVQAKEAARYVVDHLNPGDRFNIVSFSTGARPFQRELVPAEEAGADAAQFISSLEALGGTNINLALLETVAYADAERPLTILFLTDGLATEGVVEADQILRSLAQMAPPSTRLFAFGVGDDVDTFLLDSLAQNHRGTTTYVRPFQAIDEAVSGFYAKVSTPVLADISLDTDSIVIDQVYPATLPDLFAGTQLIIAGRYREGGPATITLRGTVNGRTQNFVYEDNAFATRGGDEFIPRLWATRAIGHLLNEIRLKGENSELVQSVVNLSIRYGIITPYTSYLIEEDDIFSQSGRQSIVEEAEVTFAAPAAVSGEAAVERADAAGNLAAAEVAAPAPMATMTPGGEGGGVAQIAVQFIGSKTFVLSNGVWTDTAYDADVITPEEVGFASDAYFALLDAAPDLGRYFALGERVLVVVGDVAYEIVPGEGQAEVTLPAVEADGGSAGQPATQPAPETVEETATETSSGTKPAPGTGICASTLLLPLFLLGGLGAGQIVRRR